VTEVHQGEVYWFDFGPAKRSEPADRRPCVVVQSDVFNQSRLATTVVCAITSNLSRANAPGNVALTKGAGGLPKASVINVTQVWTVNKSDLDQRIGRLPASVISAVRSGLELLFDTSFSDRG